MYMLLHPLALVNAHNSTSSVPLTFLLGLPALVIGWALQRFDQPLVRTTSLIVLFESVVGFLLSLAAASEGALKAASFTLFDEERLHIYGWHIVISHPVWALIVALCLAHAALSLVEVILHHLRFRECLRTSRGTVR